MTTIEAMSPLFGNKAEKAADEAAAKAEAERLVSLPALELAVEIMPAFGSEGPGRGNPPELNLLQLGTWLMRSQRRSARYLRDLERPIRAAVQALEVAGLVQHRGQSNRLLATAAGQEALANGTAADQLVG